MTEQPNGAVCGETLPPDDLAARPVDVQPTDPARLLDALGYTDGERLSVCHKAPSSTFAAEVVNAAGANAEVDGARPPRRSAAPCRWRTRDDHMNRSVRGKSDGPAETLSPAKTTESSPGVLQSRTFLIVLWVGLFALFVALPAALQWVAAVVVLWAMAQ